jgi:predicted Fe-S protein YdhL (DUF1289 family)
MTAIFFGYINVYNKKICCEGEWMNIKGERDMTDSPCVGICSTTNVGDDICRGCGRTAVEVIDWNGYTDQEKIAINKRLGTSV